MANLPANPGESMWIGSAGGKNHYNVGIGQGTAGGDNHIDFTMSAIEDGYTDPLKFYLNSDGNTVFAINAGAGKTSTNTAHPRSELRELTASGAQAAWDGRSGEHRIKGKSRMIDFTSNKPWVCFFQAHGSPGSPNTSDLFRVQTEGAVGTTTNLNIVCRRTPPGAVDEIVTTLRTGYDMNDWIAWEAAIINGRLQIWLDGVEVLNVTGMGQILCYWKMGCYLQDNVAKGATASDYAAVEVERGSFVTWHTGYPPPTNPVFGGGTDPGGGVDSQAPTQPTDVVAIRADQQITLSWTESTDNVGVHHYNVYRTGPGGGTSTSTTTMGKLTAGSTFSASSADKTAVSSVVASASGTLTGAHIRSWLSATGTANTKAVVYSNSAGLPLTKLAESDVVALTITAEAATTYTFSGANRIAITSGTTYWIGLAWQDPGTPSLNLGRDATASGRQETSTYAPSTFSSPSAQTGPVACYIDVEVTTAATGTIGKTAEGAETTSSTADKMIASVATSSTSGTLTEGHARLWLSSAGSTTAKMVVYADNGGAPAAKLATSDQITITNTTTADKTFTFTGGQQIAITASTDYWIAITWDDPGSPSITYSRDSVSGKRLERSDITYGTPPDPWGTSTFTGAGPIDAWLVTGSAGEGTSLIGTATTATYVDTGLTNGTLYTYALSAEDAAGNISPLSAAVSQTPGPPNTSAPTVPAGLTATAGDKRVVLSWEASTDDEDSSEEIGPAVGTVTTFTEGFELGNFSRWNSVQNHSYDGDAAAYSLGTTYSQKIVNQGVDHPHALRTEVRNGDTAVGSDERAELSGFGKSWATDTDSGTERWYEFDIKLGDPTWTDAVDWMIIAQWHQVNDPGAPALALSAHSDGVVYFEREPDDTPTTNVAVWTIRPGVWERVIIHVKWSPNPAVGFVHAYVNGVETVPLTLCQTMYTSDHDNYYMKIGTYRKATNVATSVVLHDNIRISGPPAASAGAPEVTGILRYQVWRDGARLATTTASTLTYVDTAVTNGTTYSYTVSAVDLSGNESAQSSAANATPGAVVVSGGVPVFPHELGPDARMQVEIAFGADLSADPSTWVWTDVTEDVRQDPGISCSLGRNDESSSSNPATLTLVLDNSTGNYSLGGRSAYYPYVRRGTPVRWRIDPGDAAAARTLFFGNADGFTPGWGALSFDSKTRVVTLSASGTLRRLGQGDAPVIGPYRRAMIADPTVVAYWPLEEGKDALFAPAVRGGTELAVISGEPDWTANDDFACSGPLPAIKTGYLSGGVDPYAATGANEVRWLLSLPADGIPDGVTICHVSMTGTISRWDITYEVGAAGPGLGVYRWNNDGTRQGDIIVSPMPALNGKPVRLSLQVSQSGSNIVWLIGLVEARPGAGAQYLSGTITGKTCGIVRQIELNPLSTGGDMAIGHVTVSNAVSSLFTDTDALIAHEGETPTGSDGRIVRLCAEAGVRLTRFGSSGETISEKERMGPQLIAPLLELLRSCEIANGGQVWDGKDAGLVVTTRQYRENGNLRLTIDASDKQLAPGFAPVDDDQRTRNKWTITKPRGVTATYEDVDGAMGTDAIGEFDDSGTVNTQFDEMARQYAAWLVNLGTAGGYRFPAVTINARSTPDLVPDALDVIPGDRIDLTGIADDAIPLTGGTISLIVEGISHDLTASGWRINFQCSLFSPWGVGRVASETGDTSVLVMRLDSDGSTLAAAALKGATSLSVASTAGAALWTTVSDDFPLWLSVGGLPVRATACSGSTSPQTFTVDALPVARASGAVVAIWDPRPLGLG